MRYIKILFIIGLLFICSCERNDNDFVLLEYAPLLVQFTGPTDGADRMPTSLWINIAFEQHLLLGQPVSDYFSIDPHTPGTVNIEGSSSDMIIFRPDSLLLQNTKYTVILKKEIKSELGKCLENDLIFSFTTGL